jgi:pilus assembly protein CpaF
MTMSANNQTPGNAAMKMPTPPARPGARPDAPRPQYIQLKANVHRKLLNRLNLEALASVDRQRAESEIRTLLFELIAEENQPLSMSEREQILSDVLDEVFGLGPLEPLLRDPSINDILVNTYKQVYVEKHGVLERVPASFQDDRHLMRVIDRIVSAVGRRVDDSSPMVDARLADGSRVNAIIPPLAVDGPLLSIRRFPKERLKAEDLITYRALTRPMLDFLSACVKARLNAIISGGTGAGKTTLLNIMSSFISDRDRIATIEDAAELQLHQEHVVRLETRPPNVEGKGAIKQRQLVINALRMRPDRIVVGEVRGEEALDMLQAMNTGHDGSLTTIHANTPRDALSRIETMIAMGNINLPEKAMRQQIAAAIQVVVQQSRMADGSRKVTNISEITGMEGDVITMQDIFVFEKMGMTQDGKVMGRFRATGVRPKCAERLKSAGIHLPPDMFEGVTEVR